MVLFKKGEWKLNILLDFTGIHWNLLETTGNHWKLKEMLERVEFHTRLATRGRIHIPKVIVEQWMIWKDTLIHEKRLLQASALVGDQEVGFGPRMISWGRAASCGAGLCRPFFSRMGLT